MGLLGRGGKAAWARGRWLLCVQRLWVGMGVSMGAHTHSHSQRSGQASACRHMQTRMGAGSHAPMLAFSEAHAPVRMPVLKVYVHKLPCLV